MSRAILLLRRGDAAINECFGPRHTKKEDARSGDFSREQNCNGFGGNRNDIHDGLVPEGGDMRRGGGSAIAAGGLDGHAGDPLGATLLHTCAIEANETCSDNYQIIKIIPWF